MKGYTAGTVIKSWRPTQYGRNFAQEIYNAFSVKCLKCDNIYIEFDSQGSIWRLANVGSHNGLVPIRRQGIMWIDYGLV